jgi:hypothetical protein
MADEISPPKIKMRSTKVNGTEIDSATARSFEIFEPIA